MLKITRNGYELPYKSFVFPGGEVGFKLDLITNKIAYIAKTNFFERTLDPIVITAKLRNSNDVMSLAMAANALREVDNDADLVLVMPYCPYGRQDRVCDEGEAFSLKVFANIINSLNFKKVVTVDPHSGVTNAVFNNLKVVSQFDLVTKRNLAFTSRVLKSPCLFVAPDAGGNKKTSELARYFSHSEFVRADKLRDLTNGNIKETIVYCDDFKGKDVFVCDDILDGGRTFTELAKVCKKKNCGKFVLFVTHGIFSKGLDVLFNEGVDEIFTTDSLYEGNDPRVTVLSYE